MDKPTLLMKAFLLWSATYRASTSWLYRKYEKDLHSYINLDPYTTWQLTGAKIKYTPDKPFNVIQSLGETWKKKAADCNNYAWLGATILGRVFYVGDTEYLFSGIYCSTDFKGGHYVAVWNSSDGESCYYVDNDYFGEGWAWEDKLSYKYLFRLDRDLNLIRRLK